MDTSGVPSIDTGLRAGAQNNAFDREWLRLASLGERGSLLRFHRSVPTASVGCHQVLDRELRVDYCERQGLGIVRRPSGGGALYLDPGCLCFSLTLAGETSPRGGLQEILARAGQGVGEGLRRLGLECAFKAPNDLEVAGCKIASVFVAADGGAWLVQGTVLVHADARAMLEALRVPTEKLSPDGLAAARERLATLAQCLGREPGQEEARAALERGLASAFGRRLRRADGAMDPDFSDLTVAERAIAGSLDWGEAGEGLLEAVWKGSSATLRARGGFEQGGRRFRRVELAGDFHLATPGWLEALQEGFAGLPAGLARRWVEDFCRQHPPDVVGAGVEDFARIVELLVEKQAATSSLGLNDAQANALMLHGARGGLRETLARATVMLVPYCAKPGWCKWRHLDGCSECGLCEVGEAYRLARERGMDVTTVTRYEHLVATLADMRSRRVPAYVGMCCSNFFIKRQRAFREAEIPGLLMDISGANCYELKQENQAYAGTFSAEAKLDLEVLRRVMRFVPGAAEKPQGEEAAGGDREAGELEGGAPRG